MYGPNFTLIDGIDKGETFQNVMGQNQDYVAFDHPFNLNLKCRSIKGWPKLYLEAWGTDSDGRNSLLGYGVSFIPFANGFKSIDCHTWRPDGGFLNNCFLSITPEFKDKSIVYSSEEKFALDSVSSGRIEVELDIILKDFELHGIE